MREIDEILTQPQTWRKENKKVAIATVISTWGSSPRPVGSQMAISEKLEIIGTVFEHTFFSMLH